METVAEVCDTLRAAKRIVWVKFPLMILKVNLIIYENLISFTDQIFIKQGGVM